MKIVTWNCNGALRNKLEPVNRLEADIYVIQECENPAESKDNEYKNWASNHLWIGDNKNRGLGVFANKGIQLKQLAWTDKYHDHSVKYFLPCKINEEFQLLAVWAHHNSSPTFGYIGQFWKYLQVNNEKKEEILILGDLNSNSIWDKWDRWWNHSDVVKELRQKGILSLYHEYYGESQGRESKPTFHLQRNQQKPYHIDYCFASPGFQKRLKRLMIGDFEYWKQYSDHLPIQVEFS